MTTTNTTDGIVLATFDTSVPEIKRIVDRYMSEHPNEQITVDGDRKAIIAHKKPVSERGYGGSDGSRSGFMGRVA